MDDNVQEVKLLPDYFAALSLAKDDFPDQFSLRKMPVVINKKMLIEAILDQYPKSIEERKVLCEEGIDYTKIFTLRLEFRFIIRMEYFWLLVNLKELFLNNNIIEEIQGLHYLVNLTRLDLSFNNIEEIKGLDKLVKLEQLSLFQNKISVLKNLDNLVNLRLLSVGNNLIEDFDNVLYLKPFKNLHSLNLHENPVTKIENCKLKIVAVLPRLRYLDYRLITDEMKTMASNMFRKENQEALTEIFNEMEEETIRKREEETAKRYKDAMIDLVVGDSFVKMLFQDEDSEMLYNLPKSDAIFDKFKNMFLAACKEIVNEGMIAHNERQKELEEFLDGSEMAKSIARNKSIEEIESFLTYKKAVFANFNVQGSELPGNTTAKNQLFIEYQNTLDELEQTLTTFEMDLVEQIEDNNREFEHQIKEMIEAFEAKIRMFINTLRDYEQQFFEQFKDFCQQTIEKYHKIITDEDVENFLFNRQKVQCLITKCHEKRVAIINEREQLIINRLHNWLTEMIAKIYREEIERNRKRVHEIICFKDYHEKEGNCLIEEDESDQALQAEIERQLD